MRYSTLSEIRKQKSNVSVFGGYNHNISIPEGDFFDMQNMTSSNYPVLSPRGKRGLYEYPEPGEHKVNGLIGKESLCYVDGEHLYVNNSIVEGITLTDGNKQLVSMGAYIVIFPDKKFVNTKDLTEYGDIEASFTTEGTVTYTMCRIDGTEYENVTISATAPSNPQNMAYWIDTSSTPHTLKQWASTSSMWTPIATTYIRINAKDIAKNFKQYDSTKITGIDESIEQLKDLEGKTSILYEVHRDEDGYGAGDYVVVVGFIDNVTTQTNPLSLDRSIPNMDFVIESGNRLWGCRYGTNINGDVVNEIYASKLGDFKNWNSYMGLSTDSYAASCGTDGAFTGAITHQGYPIFFKENCMHKVYGNFPSNYQIQTTDCRGVMLGACNSLAIVNTSVFYKSRTGICVYDGSLPSEISSALGDIHYSAIDESMEDRLRSGAVAGSHGNKYYISMMSEKDNKWYLFVFDTKTGMWHKEDETRVESFCSIGGEMYFIDHSDKQIKTILGSGIKDGRIIEWMAETGVIGTSTQSGGYNVPLSNKKYVSQLLVRMSLEVGSSVSFYIQYDSCGQWEHVSTVVGTRLLSHNTQIRPRRCDHFRIRIVGKGEAKIFSITKTLEEGSDI